MFSEFVTSYFILGPQIVSYLQLNFTFERVIVNCSKSQEKRSKSGLV